LPELEDDLCQLRNSPQSTAGDADVFNHLEEIRVFALETASDWTQNRLKTADRASMD
jgi:hypothetical protein